MPLINAVSHKGRLVVGWIRSRLSKTDLWLWPTLEVVFIAVFSLLPLMITAAFRALRSRQVDWLGELGNLIAGGQLMYYALGFIATAAWVLLMDIKRPRLFIPLLALAVVTVVVGVAITIGIDPNAQSMNAEAFRSASYVIFFVSLITYLLTTILRAWQPSLNIERENRAAEEEFVKRLGKELKQS
jgi:hypothetical protein